MFRVRKDLRFGITQGVKDRRKLFAKLKASESTAIPPSRGEYANSGQGVGYYDMVG